ncbi:MAG: winged helix-turn-helix transcriptional regulator [Spirochaetia bacterium]|jgi:predicted transcriptional regulator|nr:winged helix-turn-helix transcriptional regulator [Spirochaetia bacterium]
MLHIHSLHEGLPVFKALGSEVRVKILELLLEDDTISLNELAKKLNITNGALSSHIKKLESCGLISIAKENGPGHGNLKKCKVYVDKILIELENQAYLNNVYQAEIRIGHYSDHEVYPTCGLASAKSLIGEVDDSRYFDHPDRYEADLLWFTKGYVTYEVPNFIPPNQKIDQISLSFEIGSEAPGSNDNWPSDIYFLLNGKNIGKWLSPGDFGSSRGLFSPDWWYPNWNQYGLLKLLVVNRRGTFIDGIKISDVSLKDFDFGYRSRISITFSVPEYAEHVGGLTLFGKSFGNYRQNINVQLYYSPVNGT